MSGKDGPSAGGRLAVVCAVTATAATTIAAATINARIRITLSFLRGRDSPRTRLGRLRAASTPHVAPSTEHVALCTWHVYDTGPCSFFHGSKAFLTPSSAGARCG